MTEVVERATSWAGFYTGLAPPQGPKAVLHKQQFSCMLLMNGSIPGNDMGCAAVCLYAAFVFPGLCHAHSITEASFECWDEKSRSRMHHSGQETGTKCQKSPVEAGDVTLGHSGGFFMVLLTGRALAAPSPPILGSSLKGSCQYVPCALSFPPGSVQQSVAVVFPGRRAALQVFNCLSP